MSLTRRRRLPQLAVGRGDLAVLALSVLVAVSVAATAIHDDQPVTVVLVPVALAAIFLRRRRPVWALTIAVLAASATPGNRALVLPVMVVLYAIAARAPWKLAAQAGAAAAAVAILGGALWGSGSTVTEHGGLLGYAIGIAASCAAAVAVGLYVGAQRRVRDGLRERAERLDRERELLADRAVAEERVRIARELHDIVAHNVSLMVVEAQALGATVPDERVVQRTDAIANLGREAMTEMHATLRLLRGDGDTPELSPQPGLAQLERLIDQLRRAGLEIELTVEGRPRPLAQGIDLSAYRIIQEALTNVVKHAAGARTKVTLVYHAQGVEVTIIDTEHEARATPLPRPSDGHGVIGMRERAALFGGRLTTESLPNGFKVTATLPYAPTPS